MTPRLRSALERVRGEVWPVLQAAVAAGIAYFISANVLGHPQPIFAPTAAVVALAVEAGGRGRQAIQMLVGVGTGVAVGELLALVLGAGTLQVALAAGVAMLTVAIIIVSPLPLIQAGVSAVLVVTLQSPQSGGERALDALTGAAVALIFSQILFAPSPVSLLDTAAREALRSISRNLRASADALADGDAEAAEAALTRLREEGRSALSGLDAARGTARQVSRRTLRGRRQAGRLARLDARLAETDLLLADALLLVRAARRFLDEPVAVPDWPAPAIRDLARAVESFSEAPESLAARSSARGAALKAVHRTSPGEDGGADLRVALVAEGVRLVASNVLRAAAEDEAAEPAAPETTTSAGGERGRDRAP